MALEALAQENRLAAFRELVKAGASGLTPGRLSLLIDVPASTLSFHLAQLRHAGLVQVTRQGRSLTYVAAFEAMDQLVQYLTENCCDGTACVPAACVPYAGKAKQRAGTPTALRSRRRG